MTFENLVNQYVKSPGFEKLSQTSKSVYMYGADNLIRHFKDADITKLRRSDFFKFQQELTSKPSVANLSIRIASVLFSYAVDMDIAAANPVANMKKLKGGSHERWSVEEVSRVIALNDRKISTAVALAWYTGQRESDVLSMRWSDYDGDYIRVIQQKTGVEMKIKAHPDLVRYLNELKNKNPADYIVSGTNRMSGPAFRNMLKRRLDKLGIRKVFHGIRKGVASSLAENGRPISEIAAIMGHKSIRMAAYYAEQASGTTLRENAVSNLTSVTVQEPC